MRIFILGADDPEMREIRNVLTQAGEQFVFARERGARVRSGNAYHADGTSDPLPKGAEVIFVECSVLGLTPSLTIDHHRPGDPGYDCEPEDYLHGSSLGQTLLYLKMMPTLTQRVICAADHCPSQAYLGRCPGVLPEELAKWRRESKAAVKGVTPEVLEELIQEQRQRLMAAERIDVAGTPVAWLPDATDEAPEASARYDIPFMYRSVQKDGRTKVGILGAPPAAIAVWMDECGLFDVYGNPSRGYAGGYLEKSAGAR
jgi:hypothetical protein